MQLMPMIQQKFWTKDGNNLPLSFGSLTFYYHGTTDFAPTYQNNGGAENDNPLPLDINGECQVWLDPAISYDIILKDASGADVDTREAVQVGDGGGGGGDAFTVKVTALDSTPNTLNYKVTNENAGIRVSTTGSAGTNQALQIGVKLSTDPTNAASLDATGLFVSQGRQGPPGPAGVVGSVVDTDSVDLTLTGDVLQADVRISSTIGNGLTLNPDGLYSSGTPTVSDTNSIDLTILGGVLSGDVKISATAGNNISVSADGLYSATPDLSGYILKDTSAIPYPGNFQPVNTYLSVGNYDTLTLSGSIDALKQKDEAGASTIVSGFPSLVVNNLGLSRGRYYDFAMWTTGTPGFYEYHQAMQTRNNTGVVITNGLVQKASNYGADYIIYDYLHGEGDRYARLSDVGGLASVSVTDSATVTWTGDGTPSTPLVATAIGFVKSSGHTDLGTMPWSIGDGASVAASTGAYTMDTASISYKNQFKGGLSVDGWMFTNGRVEAQLALWSQASTSGLVYGYMANQGALLASGSDSSRMILEHTAATSGRRVFDQLCKNTSVFWRWLSDDASALNKECFAVDANGTMLLAQNLKIGLIPTGTQTYLLGQDSTGQVIRGSTPISATVGNAITLNADGVYAPTPAVATTTTSLIQTVEKADTTTITMPSAWTMYGYCDRMPYGGTFNSIDVISPNGLGGSGTGIRGFVGKVTSRTAGNYTATILARTANYATNSTGLVNIALSNAATLLQGEEWCLILRVDKSASGDLLALVPSAGLSSSNYLSLGENVAGTDPAVGAAITFYAGTPAMLPWVRALA